MAPTLIAFRSLSPGTFVAGCLTKAKKKGATAVIVSRHFSHRDDELVGSVRDLNITRSMDTQCTYPPRKRVAAPDWWTRL